MVVFCLVILPLLLVLLLGGDGGPADMGEGQKRPVTVFRHASGKTVTLDLEDYVAGVVAGEMPATFELEALKAQAVAARTYALSKMKRAEESGNSADHPSAPLCDDTHCQVYRDEAELLKLKGQDWMEDGWVKILEAVSATSGEVMYYDGILVEQPLFHSASGGKTENSEDVFASALPYLRSVDSLYEGAAPYQNETISISLTSFIEKVGEAYGASSINSNSVKILSRSEGGRVEEINVGDKVLTGRNLRDLFGLRSANFTFAFDGNENILFTTDGYGHGVGMSQWGANGMAQASFGYEEILEHYYTGVTIEK
jgi:stage II sporulation protein D